MINSPTPATLSGRSLTTGAHPIKRPKSIWFDTGDDDQSPAVSQEPMDTAPVAAAAPTMVPEPAPADDAVQDTSGVRLPIFDSVESEWFRRGTSVWTSPADEGFRVAQTVVGLISQTLSALVGATGVASVYYELRQVKEGVGAEQLAAVFD